MPNERFTDFPTTGAATMGDIILAVQGYVSPSTIGMSVQESLQQVFNLFQSNVILFNAGNPNGAIAGSTFQLCWDTTNTILYVCTTTGTATSAVWTKSIHLTAGSGITIVQSGNTITLSSSASGLTWNNETSASATMVSNNGYVANFGSLVTLTLPVTSSFGDVINIVGQGAGGWSIAQAAGQQVIVGSASSTVGVTGSVSSTNQFDAIELVCVVANTTWQAPSAPQGNLTIV